MAKSKNQKGSNPSIAKIQQLPLKASRINCIRQATKTDWNTAWTNNKSDSRMLRKITAQYNVYDSAKIYGTITKRNDVALLARLRTGHCSVNQYLHRFGIEDSPLCSCESGAIEAVDHYVTNCPKYDQQRSKLMRGVGANYSVKVFKKTSKPGLLYYHF